MLWNSLKSAASCATAAPVQDRHDGDQPVRPPPSNRPSGRPACPSCIVPGRRSLVYAGSAGNDAARDGDRPSTTPNKRSGSPSKASPPPADAGRLIDRADPQSLGLHPSGEPGDSSTLSVANRLFGRNGARIRAPFLTLTRDQYGAPVETLDFFSTPKRRDRLIRGSPSRTRNHILDLIPREACVWTPNLSSSTPLF